MFTSAVGDTGVALPLVAIQGEIGAFSHEAALKLLPDSSILPCQLSADVFSVLSQGEVDAAVVPIENSLAGSVIEHFDLLLKYDLVIVAEALLRIRHNLIALTGVAESDISTVYSHPVALAQCRKFFATRPAIRPCAFYDTAGSVKHLAETANRTAAAIASSHAAQQYGAVILAANIEDNPENYTRFFLLRRRADAPPISDANKLSLAFSVENRPGSLVTALQRIADQGTNLTKIESRPVHGRPWEYVFYVDCQLTYPEAADRTISALSPNCAIVRELGRYREATGD
jgi:prephenate dehydratase